MAGGEAFATASGMTLMLRWCVDSWASGKKTLLFHSCYTKDVRVKSPAVAHYCYVFSSKAPVNLYVK